MLYTVVPLERIYSCRDNSILNNSDVGDENNTTTNVEYKNVSLQHGKIYAKRDGENYVVEGISSTNMQDYLNQDYMPGVVLPMDNNPSKNV